MTREGIQPTTVEDVRFSSKDKETEPNERTNIILIGMPKSGKTTVGRILAEKMGFEFIDTDQEIEEREGMTVSEIFADNTKGQLYFRRKESELAKEILQKRNQIVSTGGGMVENKDVISHFFREGVVFYLRTPLKTLIERSPGDTTRPRTTDEPDEVAELAGRLNRRQWTYETADVTLDTHGKTPEEIAVEIMEKYAEIKRKEADARKSLILKAAN